MTSIFPWQQRGRCVALMSLAAPSSAILALWCCHMVLWKTS